MTSATYGASSFPCPNYTHRKLIGLCGMLIRVVYNSSGNTLSAALCMNVYS